MPRAAALVRDAVPDDAEALLGIWSDFTAGDELGRSETPSVDDVRAAVARLAADPFERLVVTTVDDVPVGVAHLRRAPISPIHDEDAVHVGYLHVLSGHRRRGLGKQLLEAAADWADAKDTTNIVATVAANARDANRFLARLGLAQVAVVRATSVVALRGKLDAAGALLAKPATTNVVAARRLMRRRRQLA
jgi:GNAT superfamily N-acetyltransferase